MNKIGILGVGSMPTSPDWEEKKRKMYEQLSENHILAVEDAEFSGIADRAPVMLPLEAPPIKICEFAPTPIGRGRGRSTMNEEHYQKQTTKRRKKNKNKKTHRK